MRVREVLRALSWLPTLGRSTDPRPGDDDHVGDVDGRAEGDVDVDTGDDSVGGENAGVDGVYAGVDDVDGEVDGEGSEGDDADVEVDPAAGGERGEAAEYAEPPSEPSRPEAEAPVRPHRFAGADRDACPRPHRDRRCVDRAEEYRDTGGEADA